MSVNSTYYYYFLRKGAEETGDCNWSLRAEMKRTWRWSIRLVCKAPVLQAHQVSWTFTQFPIKDLPKAYYVPGTGIMLVACIGSNSPQLWSWQMISDLKVFDECKMTTAVFLSFPSYLQYKFLGKKLEP